MWIAQEGVIKPFQATIKLTAAGSPISVLIPLAEGFLLSAVVYGFNLALGQNQYVVAWINRGNVVSYPPILPGAVLMAGYTSSGSPLSWPGSGVNYPGQIDGSGVTITPANPAAGADWSVALPQGVFGEFVSFAATLTTSAAAGNRQVQVQILDGAGNVVYQAPASQNLVASNTNTVSGSESNVTSTILATVAEVALPPRVKVDAASIVKTVTTGLAAGDQWSNISVYTRQWARL